MLMQRQVGGKTLKSLNCEEMDKHSTTATDLLFMVVSQRLAVNQPPAAGVAGIPVSATG